MSLLQNRGRINVKVLIWVLVLALAVHVAILLVPMYMDAEEMKDDMTQEARLAQVLKDDEIMSNLVKKAQDLNLPLTADSFILERDPDNHRMKIRTKEGWDVEVRFLFNFFPEYTTKIYHFEPVIDETYSTKL